MLPVPLVHVGLILSLPLLINFTHAQSISAVPVWGQCGGNGYSGSTTCVHGTTCVKLNDYYSQCTPRTASSTASSTTSQVPSSTTATATSISVPLPSTSASPGLNSLATSKGKLLYFGSATDNGELTDIPYKTILSNSKEFGQLTPGNSMKWDATEASRGVFTFTKGDEIFSLAKSNGQLLRGQVENGGFDNSTLVSILQNHVTQVATHYKGQVYAWNVLNEIFLDDGSWRPTVFYNTIGESYVSIALRAARAADPNAKLYINEYNTDGTGAKSLAMYNLVAKLKTQGVPIDGIGVQAHLISGSVPDTIQTNWAKFARCKLTHVCVDNCNLGVEVALTEVDIRMTLPVTDAKLAQQAVDYKNVVGACVAVGRCIGITIWDYTNKYSWMPSVFPGQGSALPWDENLVKKPAYAAIAAALA
ncbi:endo-1,4-B-xylanase A [Pyronema domesticum]|nr:endo-1,4-B-xylanase A [Pyronema domesticum]